MGDTLVQVDAFTDRPYRGNPAAVCLLTEPRDDHWMQALATEMNLSETAFLRRGSAGDYDLRWFTPAYEVDLCGHATLASAHVLWEQSWLEPGADARFHTRSGRLTARRRSGGIELDFPALVATRTDPPAGLLEALGAAPVDVRRNETDYLVRVDTEAAVRALQPDFRRLSEIPMRGVIVTALSSDDRFDFVSRFFAPAAGIDEDPVTGSAHCCLGPYWQQELSEDSLTAYQASTRGGVVGVRVEGERVFLTGQAVTIFRAELLA